MYTCIAFFIFVVILIYNHNQHFRYYIKCLIYLSTYILIGLSWPFFVVKRTHPNNLRTIYRIQYNLSKVLGLRVETRGEEYLKSVESCVIISNHQSSLDMIALANVWPNNCTILAKRELKYLIPLGLFSYKSGIIYIDRSDSEKSRTLITKISKRMKDEMLKIWVFPEGTRNPSFHLLPFKKGGFHMAIQAQVPICPVVISSYYPFYCKEERRFERGKISIECLPPIDTKGKTVADIPDLIVQVKEIMERTFYKISNVNTN